MPELLADIAEFLRRCGVDLDARDPSVLCRLHADLADANRTTNLTRITDEAEFWALHVADSLAIGLVCPELLARPLRVADVGCGAGFPLLPLAWANPRLTLVGVEARNRKVEFIRAEAERLGLANVSAEHAQVREAARAPSHAARYDIVLLRAVGPAGRLLRDVRGLLVDRPGAAVWNYKTPDAVAEEVPLATREAEKFGFDVQVSPPLDLPRDAGARQFLGFVRR